MEVRKSLNSHFIIELQDIGFGKDYLHERIFGDLSKAYKNTALVQPSQHQTSSFATHQLKPASAMASRACAPVAVGELSGRSEGHPGRNIAMGDRPNTDGHSCRTLLSSTTTLGRRLAISLAMVRGTPPTKARHGN